MSEEKTEDKKTFGSTVSGFFKGVGLKVKLILGAIVGIFGFISIFLLRKKLNSRAILELELRRAREEFEIEKAQEEIGRNDGKILLLEERIKDLKEEIEELDEFEARKEVSKEELDEFFDERGF